MRVGGHRFFFYSEERQEPPHIHVRSAESTAKFWLVSVNLAESHGYNEVELRRIQGLVEDHRELFLREWHEHFES